MNNEELAIVAKANYEKAQEAEKAARKMVDDLKASSASVVKTYQDAKAAFDNLKPAQAAAKATLAKATAEVTLARLEWQKVAPKEASSGKGTGNAKLLEAVTTLLTGKPNGLTNDEIYSGLLAAGVEMAGDKPRDNLNAYLSRWGSAGANGLYSPAKGSWAVKAQTPAVPPFLAPPVAQGSGGGNVDGALSGDLPLDFPGLAALHESGFRTYESIADKKTAADFQAIKGIGKATAEKIAAALGA